jgi:hypothetical protein
MKTVKTRVAFLGLVAALLIVPRVYGQGCTITCPANITRSNDPNQCGAVTTYPAPTTGGTCGTIVCSPASGSFFPKGLTTVTCSEAVANCSFTITVNDTQPPTITCPANVTASAGASCISGAVTYPPPTGTDNCPGVTTLCSPASGSTFPAGNTTTTCTATDAAQNTATCSFLVTILEALHRVHGHISTVPPTHSGTTPHSHHGVHQHSVGTQACVPHVPGHSAGLLPDGAETALNSLDSPNADSIVREFNTRIGQDGATGIARRGMLMHFFGSAAGLFLDEEQGETPAATIQPPATGSLMYYTTSRPRVQFGGVDAQVVFSGLAPGLRGIWQISVIVPEKAPTGDSVPVTFQYEDQDAGPISMAVR